MDVVEIRAFQKRSKGPADLAIHLRESLRQRIEGVSDDIDDVAEFGAHIGRFTVRHDGRAVRVLVLWLSLPDHRFWVLSILPQRTRRKRRREQDLELASHVSSPTGKPRACTTRPMVPTGQRDHRGLVRVGLGAGPHLAIPAAGLLRRSSALRGDGLAARCRGCLACRAGAPRVGHVGGGS
jgi:hypothetical protein